MTLASNSTYTYSPKGKLDPFMPWYEGESPILKQEVRKRLPLSPLEKVDLSQLKLVGIILSASSNKALVEDATGKGYVLAKGTYIGLDHGKVAKILRDRVIVEEPIQYGMSESTVRRKELKLQKPPGDI
jgi:type IV pilus assembly protein PilP